MPSFARELEQTLHNALGEASRRRHEYATLEHLLMALIDDGHASKVMTACGVNRDELKATVKQYLDGELGALVADSGTDPTPTRRGTELVLLAFAVVITLAAQCIVDLTVTDSLAAGQSVPMRRSR